MNLICFRGSEDIYAIVIMSYLAHFRLYFGLIGQLNTNSKLPKNCFSGQETPYTPHQTHSYLKELFNTLKSCKI